MGEHLADYGTSPLHLPPMEFRKPAFRHPNGRSFEPIETPLTPTGLVDKRQLFKLVNATLVGAYKWPSIKDDEHHLFWPGKSYEDSSDELVNPHEFRNLWCNKVDLPRNFHSWVHKTTLPPKIPSEETMWLVSQAQDGVDNMASAVRIGKQLLRKKSMPADPFGIRLGELYDQYHQGLHTIRQLPQEFHIIKPDQYNLSNVVEMLSLRGELGRLATKPTVATATRIIRQKISAT